MKRRGFLFNAALASGGAALTFEGFVRRFEAFADAVFCKVVGWALERTIATRLPKAALEQAIAERQPPPGLVHHSDRGSATNRRRSSSWQSRPLQLPPARP